MGSSPSQLLCLGAARLASRQRGCWAAGLLPQGTKHSLRAAKASVPARRNFQALGSKFNIAGRHSEATATAGTKCPSTEAWTSTDFATLRLGRPPGPAKTQGCNICQSASLSAWPNCPSFGCGFRVNASNFEFPPLCLEIPTRCQKSKNPKFGWSKNPKNQTLEFGLSNWDEPQSVYFQTLDCWFFGCLFFGIFGTLDVWIFVFLDAPFVVCKQTSKNPNNQKSKNPKIQKTKVS